jgi:hypothetical protein
LGKGGLEVGLVEGDAVEDVRGRDVRVVAKADRRGVNAREGGGAAFGSACRHHLGDAPVLLVTIGSHVVGLLLEEGLGGREAIFELGALVGGFHSIPALDHIGFEAYGSGSAVEFEEEPAGVAED